MSGAIDLECLDLGPGVGPICVLIAIISPIATGQTSTASPKNTEAIVNSQLRTDRPANRGVAYGLRTYVVEVGELST